MNIEKEQKRTNRVNRILIIALIGLTGASVWWIVHVGKQILNGLIG